MKKIFFSSLCLLLLTAAFAQPRTRTQLSGTIRDARTSLPLPGASVVLSDSRAGTVTDSNGHYLFRNIPMGHSVIEISYAGYKTLVEHFDISENDVHDFALMPSILENEGVTVTAVANATSIRKAPIPITRVSRTELLSTASTNIIDALSRQPGISQLSTGPAISKPVIRGLGYNRLVVINDGIRQEGQQWGDEHGIEIDDNSVSRVEIVKGPASLIYGSDAIAGVINIVTTSPVPVNTVRGNVLAAYQTNNRQRSLFANLAGNQHGFNWNAWGDVKQAADYRNRYDGRVYNSKYREANAGGYAGLNRSWGFSHLIVSSFNQELGVIEGERDVSGQLVKALPGGATALPTETDFNSTQPLVPYQQINHLKFISDNSFSVGANRLSLSAGWQRNQRREFGDPDQASVSNLHFDLQTFNYNTAFHLNDRNGWTTSIGINGMAQKNFNRGPEVLIPEYGLFDIGGFVYSLKTVGSTSFSGGVRYDHRHLDSKSFSEGGSVKFEPFSRNYSNFSGSAGLSYAAEDGFTLKFNLARGFRAPSIPELASNGTHEGTNRYEYGTRDLRSEQSFQADLGVEAASQHISVNASVFYNNIRHFIFYSRLRTASGADSLVDVGGELIPAFQFSQRNAYLYGAEVVADLHPHPLDWLHWQNTFSYVRGKFTEAVEGVSDLPLMPAPRWISELRGEFLSKGKTVRNLAVHLEADRTFSQKHAFTAFDTETPTEGYTLMNAGLSANLVKKNGGILFSLYLNATNLGDVSYQNHLSRLKYTSVNMVTGRQGVFNTGRNFSVKLNIPL